METLTETRRTTVSRERLLASLSHREPDRIPIDFGGTPVTGIHVSCIAALRDYLSLEKRLVKVHEPYQMLGMLDEDLKQAMGIDVEGVYRPKTSFGFRNRDWKPWCMPDGLEVGFFCNVDSRPDTRSCSARIQRIRRCQIDPSMRRLSTEPSRRFSMPNPMNI